LSWIRQGRAAPNSRRDASVRSVAAGEPAPVARAVQLGGSGVAARSMRGVPSRAGLRLCSGQRIARQRRAVNTLPSASALRRALPPIPASRG